MFPLECGNKCEEILETFKENIISRCKNSVVSVIPCNLFYQSSSAVDSNEEEDVDLKK